MVSLIFALMVAQTIAILSATHTVVRRVDRIEREIQRTLAAVRAPFENAIPQALQRWQSVAENAVANAVQTSRTRWNDRRLEPNAP